MRLHQYRGCSGVLIFPSILTLYTVEVLHLCIFEWFRVSITFENFSLLLSYQHRVLLATLHDLLKQNASVANSREDLKPHGSLLGSWEEREIKKSGGKEERQQKKKTAKSFVFMTNQTHTTKVQPKGKLSKIRTKIYSLCFSDQDITRFIWTIFHIFFYLSLLYPSQTNVPKKIVEGEVV